MTTNVLNPFPDYAVKRLVVGQETVSSTIVTAAIGKGRDLVDSYLASVAAPARPTGSNAALCAVRGDFGTGKTHLLNDVAAHLQESCSRRTPPTLPSIVRATCIEADPMFWFRTQLGPQLDALPLYDVALQLYGRAGKTVASATDLTESAAAVLDEDPTRIRELVRTNYLSVDEVGRQFNKELDLICRDHDPLVRRVLSRLVSSETEGPAREWIRGETLTDRQAELLGVPKAIESAEQASSLIGAIVAMHSAVARPFLLLMDEFEHFVRYDVSRNASANVTWLKRLLEQLGTAGALALVAGHWSAWQTAKDYLDRFPQYAPIDLVRLEASDVLNILRERVGTSANPPGEAHAKVIAVLTGGNMRRVMSLCNLLFRQSAGFATKLTDKQIHAAWTSVAQRISQEQVLEEVAVMLTPRGFVVKSTEATFHSVPFDLVAERGDGRVLLVQAKHSVTQGDHYDAARKFIDKLSSVRSLAPSLVGLFLANGSIDDELLAILRNSGMPNLRWFDLTELDVMVKIRAEIGTLDQQAAVASASLTIRAPANLNVPASHEAASTATAPDVSTRESARGTESTLIAMNQELERKLRELDERRRQETEALKQRLDRLASDAETNRYHSVLQESRINPERVHATFEAMLEPPSVDKKLRYLGDRLVVAIAYIVLGLPMVIWHDVFLYILVDTTGMFPMTAGVVRVVLVMAGAVTIVMGLWLIWRNYTRVADYFEFSRQALRDLYVRDVPIDVLSKVNAILLQSIARHGPRDAPRAAIHRLTSPEPGLPTSVRDYFGETSY